MCKGTMARNLMKNFQDFNKLLVRNIESMIRKFTEICFSKNE